MGENGGDEGHFDEMLKLKKKEVNDRHRLEALKKENYEISRKLELAKAEKDRKRRKYKRKEGPVAQNSQMRNRERGFVKEGGSGSENDII